MGKALIYTEEKADSAIRRAKHVRLNFYRCFADIKYCCEKSKPLKRVGCKIIGPTFMGGGVVRQMDTLNTNTHSFLRRWTFLVFGGEES